MKKMLGVILMELKTKLRKETNIYSNFRNQKLPLIHSTDIY